MWTLKSIVEQLELCDYKDDELHELKNNAAFIALKRLSDDDYTGVKCVDLGREVELSEDVRTVKFDNCRISTALLKAFCNKENEGKIFELVRYADENRPAEIAAIIENKTLSFSKGVKKIKKYCNMTMCPNCDIGGVCVNIYKDDDDIKRIENILQSLPDDDDY